MNNLLERKKKTFEALVRAVYAVREVRDTSVQAQLPLTDEEKKQIGSIHKALDAILDRLEKTGIEQDFVHLKLKNCHQCNGRGFDGGIFTHDPDYCDKCQGTGKL